MHVTFMLHNLTDDFYNRFLPVESRARFDYLAKKSAGDLRRCVQMKIGSGQFRDRVDVNAMLRSPTVRFEGGEVLPRRGYKLIAFDVFA